MTMVHKSISPRTVYLYVVRKTNEKIIKMIKIKSYYKETSKYLELNNTHVLTDQTNKISRKNFFNR